MPDFIRRLTYETFSWQCIGCIINCFHHVYCKLHKGQSEISTTKSTSVAMWYADTPNFLCTYLYRVCTQIGQDRYTQHFLSDLLLPLFSNLSHSINVWIAFQHIVKLWKNAQRFTHHNYSILEKVLKLLLWSQDIYELT